jgi:hypothetical protein
MSPLTTTALALHAVPFVPPAPHPTPEAAR